MLEGSQATELALQMTAVPSSKWFVLVLALAASVLVL